jgi:hypothetical protein
MHVERLSQKTTSRLSVQTLPSPKYNPGMQALLAPLRTCQTTVAASLSADADAESTCKGKGKWDKTGCGLEDLQPTRLEKDPVLRVLAGKQVRQDRMGSRAPVA